jgi:Ser/Thr protein kinase RdoA (MazF antagonist)
VDPLAAAEVRMLPSFVMLRRMVLTAWLASHAETPTAQALGAGYTDGTVALGLRYLQGSLWHIDC